MDSDFANYGKYSDFVFFTGHGDSYGNLCLSEYTDPSPEYLNKISANWNNIGSAWNGYDDTTYHDFEWAIFAACNVLQRNGWGTPLAYGGHHIFGYRGVSSENYDLYVIDGFMCRILGNGYTPQKMITAWKNANIAWDEINWAITGHKNNENDYIHGIQTGATPDVSGTGDIYHWYSGGGFYLSVPKSTSDETIIGDSKKLGKLTVVPEKINSYQLINSLLKKHNLKKVSSNNMEIYSDNDASLIFYPSGAVSFEREGSNQSISINVEEDFHKSLKQPRFPKLIG